MNTNIQAAAAAMLFAATSVAQGAYPEKAVLIVVPYAPAGNSDNTTRTTAAAMSDAPAVHAFRPSRWVRPKARASIGG